jgi:enoyl-CoA hydratase/carnithine racemase
VTTEARESGPLRTEIRDGVATVTIDHPPLNLVDGGFIGALVGLLDALEANDAVRVVVFTSADPDFFLMHGDVQGILQMPASSEIPDAPNVAVQIFDRLRTGPLLSIGAVDGAARGGGAEFLASLDLRYASTRAVLGQPEVPMGILPGAGGTARLAHLLGRGRALEVILTGRDVDAHEALALGWVDQVLEPDTLMGAVRAVASRIAAMPRGAVTAVKHVVDTSLRNFDDGLLEESRALAQRIASGAHVAPMHRFLADGGQTREGETQRMAAIIDAMLDPPNPD